MNKAFILVVLVCLLQLVTFGSGEELEENTLYLCDYQSGIQYTFADIITQNSVRCRVTSQGIFSSSECTYDTRYSSYIWRKDPRTGILFSLDKASMKVQRFHEKAPETMYEPGNDEKVVPCDFAINDTGFACLDSNSQKQLVILYLNSHKLIRIPLPVLAEGERWTCICFCDGDLLVSSKSKLALLKLSSSGDKRPKPLVVDISRDYFYYSGVCKLDESTFYVNGGVYDFAAGKNIEFDKMKVRSVHSKFEPPVYSHNSLLHVQNNVFLSLNYMEEEQSKYLATLWHYSGATFTRKHSFIVRTDDQFQHSSLCCVKGSNLWQITGTNTYLNFSNPEKPSQFFFSDIRFRTSNGVSCFQIKQNSFAFLRAATGLFSVRKIQVPSLVDFDFNDNKLYFLTTESLQIHTPGAETKTVPIDPELKITAVYASSKGVVLIDYLGKPIPCELNTPEFNKLLESNPHAQVNKAGDLLLLEKCLAYYGGWEKLVVCTTLERSGNTNEFNAGVRGKIADFAFKTLLFCTVRGSAMARIGEIEIDIPSCWLEGATPVVLEDRILLVYPEQGLMAQITQNNITVDSGFYQAQNWRGVRTVIPVCRQKARCLLLVSGTFGEFFNWQGGE